MDFEANKSLSPPSENGSTVKRKKKKKNRKRGPKKKTKKDDIDDDDQHPSSPAADPNPDINAESNRNPDGDPNANPNGNPHGNPNGNHLGNGTNESNGKRTESNDHIENHQADAPDAIHLNVEGSMDRVRRKKSFKEWQEERALSTPNMMPTDSAPMTRGIYPILYVVVSSFFCYRNYDKMRFCEMSHIPIYFRCGL